MWYLRRERSVFAGGLSHAWKTCFQLEANFERGGQEYFPTSFLQWSLLDDS